ncbi:ubiquitin domain-containing protein DSK2, putative [Plasmodium reichenowi]|uniref:Ubiquitin domain-containing protein DSK2, putative n=1 Tax=Plasmodium reichenowi TaxID=5854 RepID=A0A151LBX8_PLARE|nr:ubiquitin domain-containing protein DSK2, putative [Plasmodium reichenowi]KYN96463.1 ubiquitin domain-containing protein DSK2, putative [Plasmodium reichenowi]
MVINVSFKVTGGKEFTVAIEPDITVLDLKKICAEHVDIPVEAQRIIFKGKILKDKESLTLYGVADGNTMHLVRSAIATKDVAQEEKESNKNENATNNDQSTPSNENNNEMGDNPLVQMLMQSGAGDMGNFNSALGGADNFNLGNFANMLNANGGGDFNRDTISSLLNNPLARSVLNELSNNPEMLTNLVSNNPILRNTFSQSPLMQPVLENPNLLREFMRPEILQAGLQIENALNMNNNNNNNNNNNSNRPGGGFRMEDILNNLNNLNNLSNPNNTTDNNNNNNNNNANPGNNLNSFLQSPELLQVFQQVMSSNRNLGNLNFPNANMNLDFNTTNVTDNRPPEERYASQLSSLQEMGFLDNAANIQALQETGGDVNSAVTRLLERGFN